MATSVELIPGALAELFAHISHSGEITLADLYGLMAAVMNDSLTEEEQIVLDRVLRAVHRGHLRSVDHLSVVIRL